MFINLISSFLQMLIEIHTGIKNNKEVFHADCLIADNFIYAEIKTPGIFEIVKFEEKTELFKLYETFKCDNIITNELVL